MDKQKLKNKLTPEQYNVCILKGTEPPGSGKYYKHHGKGIYKCVVCGQKLFSSVTKFDSKSGWPSFFKSIEGQVEFAQDNSHRMVRTEVVCAKCGSHLGHVFDDGPKPTGKRFCINSLALDFEKS